jgi:hypothetical protein
MFQHFQALSRRFVNCVSNGLQYFFQLAAESSMSAGCSLCCVVTRLGCGYDLRCCYCLGLFHV